MYTSRASDSTSASTDSRPSLEQHEQLIEDGEEQFNTSFCRALYDYQAQDTSALSFRRDDIIEILTRLPSGWWDGLLGDERGWFPSNYVVIISDEEAEAAYAQAEMEAQSAAAAAALLRQQAPVSNAMSRSGQSEQEDWLDSELSYRRNTQASRIGAQDAGQPSDFWMPEVTPDGQIYYVNTQTGQRSKYLPQEADDDVSDGDLAGLSSTSRSGTSAFGYSEASSESENDTGRIASERWIKKLADDGVSYYYLNTLDGRVQWTAPDLVTRTAHRDASRLSAYSDDSDVQPAELLPKSRSRQNTSASQTPPLTGPGESVRTTVMELTSAERIAKSLQQVLEPPPPDCIGDLANSARNSINTVVHYIRSGTDIHHPENEGKTDRLIYNAVLAIRNLLYIAGAPSATSSYSDTSRDGKGSPSKQSTLKPAQRKVTATLSRLVLSARAIQYDSASLPAETITRVEMDSEELDRAVIAFVSEAQRHERNQQPKEFPKRLQGVFTTSHLGLGLVGGGAAGSWTGFGYLATQNELDMPSKVLGTEVISEIDIALGHLYDGFDGLTQALRVVAETQQVQIKVQRLISQISSFLSLITEIHVARHVDIDGIRQGGDTINDHYSQSVENARRQVRNLETVTQAVYEDGAALLFTAQGLPGSDSNSSPGEREGQFDLVDSLSISLRRNLDLVKQNFEALLSVGHEQSDLAQGDYNGSIDWRMSRISAINQHLNGKPTVIKHADTHGSDNGDVVDMELAFNRPGIRKLKSSPETSFDSHRTLANSELNSHSAEISVNDTLVSPSNADLCERGDDGAQSIFEEEQAPAKPVRPSTATKLQRLLGDDVYDTYVSKVAADSQPWYLRPNYSPSDIIIEPDGSIRGGTLPALIERLTAHEQADTTFSKAFLMTYKSFTTPDELLEQLVARFRIQPPENLDSEERDEWGKLKQHVIQTRVLNTFKAMIVDEGIMETEDYYILDRMKAFLSSEEVSKSTAAKQILILIERAQRGQGDVKMLINTQTSPPPAPIIPKSNKKLKLLDIDPLELARQLTILESSLYQKIKPLECLTRSREQKENADNISNSIQTSNRIADWVADSILCKEEARRRAQVIKHLIMIADRCRILHNFSTMAAIISGLNTPPIRRLKRTWEQVSHRFLTQFEACNAIIDSNKNFTKYKQVLAATAPPCVPFIGPYLTNLEFIQVGNKDMIPGGLINFRKRQKASEVINDVQRWQAQLYNLQPVPVIQTYISGSLGQFKDTKASSDHFWSLSLTREPKERDDEKMARLLQESGFL